MPLIPALGRQRQADICELEASLVYRVRSKTPRTVTKRNPVLKQASKQQQPLQKQKKTQNKTKQKPTHIHKIKIDKPSKHKV